MRETCANFRAVWREAARADRARYSWFAAVTVAALVTAAAGAGNSPARYLLAATAGFTSAMCWRASFRFGLRGGFAWRLLAAAAAAECLFELAALVAGIAHPAAARADFWWVIAGVAAQYGLTTSLYLFAAVQPDSEDDEGFTPTALADLGLLAVFVLAVEVLVLPMLAARQVGVSTGQMAAMRFIVPLGAALWLHGSSRRQRGDTGRGAILLKSAAVFQALYLAADWALPDPAASLPGMLQVLRWSAIGGAAIIAIPGRPRARLGEPSHSNRELTVAVFATASLFAALAIKLFMRPGETPGEMPLLVALGGFHASVMVFRQAMVQLENRDLAQILRRESNRLRMVLDNIDDAVVTDDPGGVIQFANRRFFEMFRIDPADLPKYTLHDLTDPDDRKVEEQASQASRRPDSDPVKLQYRGRKTDGSLIYLERRVTPVFSGSLFQGTQSVVRDISQQSMMARSQRAMAQRLEFFVSKMPLGCIIWDVDFAVQEWNDSATRIFGWSHPEVFYKRYCDFLAPPSELDSAGQWWKELVTARSTSRQTCENLTKERGVIECEWFHTSLVDDNGEVVAVASMVQDVTERKSLERQLVQSQKMEALGTLAGGVAHDFNNLLTTILGQISLALMRLPVDSPVLRGLREAETACERAADVAQQLLRFGRKSPVELRAVNLNDCVREMAGLLNRTIDPKVELELMLAPDLWLVQADATQIEQVVMNLCVNARDAIDGAGRITIEAVNEVLTESNRRPHPDAAAGEFVRLSVIDTGCGMSEATRTRIFEPFFTTKHQLKGTGLGLAMVYAIVRNHRGWVEVFSKEGRGSAFHVYLPRTHKSLTPAPPPQETPAGGTATILLADDEVPIRAMARLVLEQAGYTVIEARDGQEAVERFAAMRNRIDLAVLDVIMPRKSGWDAAKRIRENTTTLPIVFSSGYTVDGSRDESLEFVNTMFLPKPYKPNTLLSTVREALSRAPVSAPPV